LFVNETLQVRKQVRHPLHFVQNSPLGSIKPAKKGPWIFRGFFPVLKVFQGDVAEFRKGRTGEGGLSRLPGPGKKDHRERACQLFEAI
jgi:hypothetical protein